MSEEIDEIVSKLTSILNNDTSSSSDNKFSEKIKEEFSNSNSSDTQKNELNFDINTIFKLKSAFDNANSNDDPRNNLLQALKPYLRPKKKEKLDQYIKIINIIKIMDIYNSMEKGDKK